ncbi:tyrosine-type recombinase/integrase [Kistimonas asteriae]|uniref:tyrosine-type recombinase/integrase n=1 Tax=Kistimonas asteriae TaxID=517724 RepID=UPI001BAD30F1|nr:tyrosine-type recombinase/integrase [Kistimonas asteriae]
MGRLLQPKDLDNLKKTASEPVGGRGDGQLLFKRVASGSVEAYYRYRHQGKESRIKIGLYRPTNRRKAYGYSLSELREKARTLARTKEEQGGDLKAYLLAREQERQQQEIERQRKLEAEASKGTFTDLIHSYLQDQERLGKESASQSRQAMEKNVIKAYPRIAAKKARDVTPDDIVIILAAIHNRGSEAESVRIRAILHAVFNYGLKSDYDPTRVGDKRFYIQHNPVAATKKNTRANKVGERVLNHKEVKQLWDEIGNAEYVGFVMSRFIRFMLATAGQRPKQLSRARWEDFDFVRNCVTLRDRKGQGREKIHVVPLSRRALDIIEEVKTVTADYPWPFCTGVKSRRKGSKGELVPIDPSSLKTAFTRYNNQLAETAEQKGSPVPEWFTARDLRRTVKNLLVDAGVNREQRNLLQSHGLNGVDVKHYDRHEHLPEKRESMKRYDALLDKILSGEDVKLVDMAHYRKKTVGDEDVVQ